jgi:tripartite-type tricarboxylate transporter receptor subunit TctC
MDAAKPRKAEERMIARRLILGAAIAAGALGVAPKVAAQGYPEKPIKLIVPFPPGGPIDTMARFMTQALGTRLSQSIVIENRPGGGATIETRFVAASPPDGYTLLFGSSGSLAVAPALYSTLDYDPVTSFGPVAQVAIMQQLMVIRPDIPANTVAEFVDYAKARPGKLSYGAAIATPPHLMGTMFKVKAGIDSLYVPYKGSAPSVTDLLGGVTHWTIDGIPTLAPFVKDGLLRALAVASTERWSEMPQIPTMLEEGFPDVTLNAWAGVVAPAGTAPAIVSKLNGLINEALAGEEIKPALAKLGAVPKTGSPAAFAAFIKAEVPKWAYAVKVAGAKID